MELHDMTAEGFGSRRNTYYWNGALLPLNGFGQSL
jgi:hypothetical protein